MSDEAVARERDALKRFADEHRHTGCTKRCHGDIHDKFCTTYDAGAWIVEVQAEADALRWEVTRLRSGLENYGRHHGGCGFLEGKPCTCGLGSLLVFGGEG